MTLQERLRTRNGRPDGFGLGKVCDEAADRIDVLERENAALRKDAERYRWLVQNCTREVSNIGDLGLHFSCDFDNWDNVDAAIDAAMAQTAS